MALGQSVFRLLRLHDPNGSIVCRHYEVPEAEAAILWLGDVGSGFESPARGLFDRMAIDLMSKGLSSLRIRYRTPCDLDSAVGDALLGLEFLTQKGVTRAITVGHAVGAVIAIQAAAASPLVRAVAALATQSFGTDVAPLLAPRPLLLVHGERDDVRPPECSQYVFGLAREPKQVMILPGAGHAFDEVASELEKTLLRWIEASLAS